MESDRFLTSPTSRKAENVHEIVLGAVGGVNFPYSSGFQPPNIDVQWWNSADVGYRLTITERRHSAVELRTGAGGANFPTPPAFQHRTSMFTDGTPPLCYSGFPSPNVDIRKWKLPPRCGRG